MFQKYKHEIKSLLWIVTILAVGTLLRVGYKLLEQRVGPIHPSVLVLTFFALFGLHQWWLSHKENKHRKATK